MRETLDAVRSLAADGRFTAAAVAQLSLTIGSSTAVYAIVHAVFLRPLPFAEPDRVAVIWQRDLRRAMPVMEVSYGEALDWRRRARSFDHVAVIGSVNWSLTLAGTSPAESLLMAPVSASFWRHPHHRHPWRPRAADRRGRHARSVLSARAGRAGAVDAARRRGPDAAGRVRQRRRPASVARGPARARARHSNCARRSPRSSRAAVGGRKRAHHHGVPRRGRRGLPGLRSGIAAARPGRCAAPGQGESARRPRPGVCRRGGLRHGAVLRPLADHRRWPHRRSLGADARAGDDSPFLAGDSYKGWW